MENTFNHIDELIGKYLAGEATSSEIEQVERWEKESDSNRHYISQLKLIFDKASSIKEWQQFDQDAAWDKMKAKLQKREAKTVSINSAKADEHFQLRWVWRIAASILLTLGVGYYFYQQRTSSTIEAVEVIAETKTIENILPDGSDVFLNKKTKLSYSYDKEKKQHTVKLKGEAYFDIKHDEKKKFIIDVDGVFIRDIGTSFNVKAYPKSGKIEVVVKEGEVEFFTEKDSGVFLRAGGKGVYDKQTKKFLIEQPESNVLAYKTKFFSFNDENLESAVHELNEVYDKEIILSDKLKSCRLTVTFNNEDIDEIARVLADTYNLSVKETSNKIILDGAGCEK
ncbi:MAG TPA: FecR domain-containing protein [Cyclobacteriaceae bacterium]